jgi:homoserine kinase
MSNLPRVVEVRAPATVANLGPGFDILGMALSEPFDVIRAERSDTPGIVIESITGDGGRLPLDAKKNTAGVAAAYVLEQIAALNTVALSGVKLSIHKGLPLESGMGSSSASAVGGAVAINALFGNPLRREDLLPACVEGEAAVSGRHADNVAPALLGGIVLITGLTADAVYRLPVPNDLILALVTPKVSVATSEARAVLPKMIPLSQMVQQSMGVALLISAIHRGDVPLMAKAVERDVIVEPARESLMPGLVQVRQEARKAGALATIISGAGPTLCSICTSVEIAHQVTQAMQAVYDQMSLDCVTRVTTPALEGATVTVIG